MNLERLKRIPNGDKVTPTFTAAEMEARLMTLRKQMADDGLAAVVFTSYHNINYYSDFLYTAFGRPYALVVTEEGATTVSANIDAGMPWRRTFGDNLVYTDWRRDNFEYGVAQVLAEQGITEGRLGVENDHINPDLLARIMGALPGMRAVDVAAATMRLRMIKSAEEIELIKHGARIADLGGAAVREAIAEGVPEYEVAIAGSNAMIREIARTFLTPSCATPGCGFSPGSTQTARTTGRPAVPSRAETSCRSTVFR